MSERSTSSGRAPDPTRADEIYVGARAAENHDLHVGSTLRVRVATPRELGKFAETSRFRAGADPETTGTGPLLTLRVVGVVAEVLSEDTLALSVVVAWLLRDLPAGGGAMV